MTPIVNVYQLYTHRDNWKDPLFLAAEFARVAIKELLLSGVPLRLSECCTFYFAL